jgi:putative ABC transport system substrate-binding protein
MQTASDDGRRSAAGVFVPPKHHPEKNGIGRRAFIAGLGSSAAAWPLSARAQRRRKGVLRIGIVWGKQRSLRFLYDAFTKRMAALGHAEGETVVYETVWIADFARTTVERAFREIVWRKVDIVFAGGPESSIRAAAAATNRLPIVIASPDFDPVAGGLAKSYRAPGGNLTGIYSVQAELTAKRLQLYKEAIPDLKALTVFWDKASAAQWRDAPKAASALGLDLFGVEFTKPPYDFDDGFAKVPAKYRSGLLVLGSPEFAVPERRRLPDFALRHRVPAMYVIRNYVDEGGLMSYGANFPAIWARAAEYVDRIANGANPATLPLAQPPRFDFVINLRTAQALDIKPPRSILLRATEVIE